MRRRPARRALVSGALALGALSIALAGCGGGGGGGTTKTATGGKVDVNAADIHFDVDTIKVAPGPLTITLHETGSLEHTFTVNGQNFALKVGPSKKTDTGTVTLTKGTYRFECTIGSHAQQGMKGKIVVG